MFINLVGEKNDKTKTENETTKVETQTTDKSQSKIRQTKVNSHGKRTVLRSRMKIESHTQRIANGKFNLK